MEKGLDKVNELPSKVRLQLLRDFRTANDFQKNIDNALESLRTVSMTDDIESWGKCIQYNKQMKLLYTERVNAVLEAFGIIDEESVLDVAQITDILAKL